MAPSPRLIKTKKIRHRKSVPNFSRIPRGADIRFNIQSHFHLDSGSNVHITNQRTWLIDYKTTTNTLQQVTGTSQSIQGIGKLPYILDNIFYILNDVQYMPNNPHNTISPSALKTLDGFTKVAHDCGTDVIFKNKMAHHIIFVHG